MHIYVFLYSLLGKNASPGISVHMLLSIHKDKSLENKQSKVIAKI